MSKCINFIVCQCVMLIYIFISFLTCIVTLLSTLVFYTTTIGLYYMRFQNSESAVYIVLDKNCTHMFLKCLSCWTIVVSSALHRCHYYNASICLYHMSMFRLYSHFIVYWSSWAIWEPLLVVELSDSFWRHLQHCSSNSRHSTPSQFFYKCYRWIST